MEEYAGRVLADRYRLPRPPADEYELVETRAFDTYSGQEVLLRQVLLPEIVDAELPDGQGTSGRGDGLGESAGRALAAARAAAAVPDHPQLVQVFDVFAEDGSLWIASEFVPARPLAALLAERPLDAYRAAEIAADVLTALRMLHGCGWTHRNVTAGTVLVCDDGRAMLGGLAAGAAQEALCGYDPLPQEVFEAGAFAGASASAGAVVSGGASGSGGVVGSGGAEGGRPGDGGELDGPDGEGAWHGPRSALEQERARQNRITVVGAVTERWAPEQAHTVHENWRLSPPVGPAADLWALGALLFRSVQGHPPYPEESAAELVQLVCAEPPAFAEDCGPLRPVVESLLRSDPEERPEAEELGGWLRSLVRSAPEPDLGVAVVPMLADPARLPVKRRRGELVRRRRRGAANAAGEAATPHRRHARGKHPGPAGGRNAVAGRDTAGAGWGMAAGRDTAAAAELRPARYAAAPPAPARAERAPRQSVARPDEPRREPQRHEQIVSRRPDRSGAAYRPDQSGGGYAEGHGDGSDQGSPRRLGVRLLGVVLVILLAAVLYALLAMPHRGGGTGSADGTRTVPASMSGGDDGAGSRPTTGADPTPSVRPSGAPTTAAAHTAMAPPPAAPADLGPDFALRTDPAGFTVAVHTGWTRSGPDDRHRVRWSDGDVQLLVVPGRDSAAGDSQDPLAYQLVEPELADFRASSWSSASGLQTLTVHGHPAAEGEYTWRDADDRAIYARNLAIQIDGRYHVVLVSGPDAARATVQRAFDKAVETYTAG